MLRSTRSSHSWNRTARLFPAAVLLFALGGCKPAPTSATPDPAASGRAAAVASKPAQLGEDAPDFTLKDLDGKDVQLSSFKGKTVVLEWFNPGCPFVKANHGQGSLKEMAKRVTKDGTVWLAINSSAPGKQGHGVDTNRKAKGEWSMDHPILMDDGGAIGRVYGAKTTPHMYVVDKTGKLAYRGAIDNAPDGDPRGSDKVINYVDLALADLAAGRPVGTKETPSYGCSVKYASN